MSDESMKNKTSSIGIYLLISLGFGLLFFLLLVWQLDSVRMSLGISAGFALLVFVWTLLDQFLGKKRHSTILKSKGFQVLLSQGFTVEQKADYHGLTGMQDTYIVDIYYDWDTYVKHRLYKAVIFNMYFHPPRFADGSTNPEKLKSLADTYDLSRSVFKSYNFWWRDGTLIMRNGVGIFNPSAKKLRKRLSIAVTILQSEGLLPVNRRTLDEWRETSPGEFVPEIELYPVEK